MIQTSTVIARPMDRHTASHLVLAATTRAGLPEAFEWITRGRKLVPDVSQQQLLRALGVLADEPGSGDALRALARRAAATQRSTWSAQPGGRSEPARPDGGRRAVGRAAQLRQRHSACGRRKHRGCGQGKHKPFAPARDFDSPEARPRTSRLRVGGTLRRRAGWSSAEPRGALGRAVV